ncbi:MAG TPA: tetratricopeptide repeat protein [Bacteroidales bacterium]|nr:tetratricopeptide repeat protein [Bacteroidales bacterium]
MAKKKKDENPQTISNVEETLSKTEHFLEENYKPLLISLGVIVGIVGLVWLGKIYLNNRNDEAQSQMYQAERYLEMDSLNLALNGDGNYLGFLDIAKDYKFTKAGNLARYSAGICYLHLGSFQEAIDYLDKYSKKDKVIGSLAIGATGDAYVELGETDKGISKYIEAANYAGNSFNTPLFLMKAAGLYELQNKYSDALALYERIQKEYPESTEGASIDKYIARVKILMK